jgi:hypothetical protein
VLGVVDPIAGGDTKLNVPPKVKLPDDVTVPVKVKPLTVPVPATEVTVPVVGVVHVGTTLAPAEVNTWPDVPAKVAKVKPDAISNVVTLADPAVVAPMLVPLIEPPVMATALAAWTAIVPRPSAVLAAESVVAPVPPLAIANVPPRVNVPEVVIGPPVKVRPVVPPEPFTDVTVPVPARYAQVGAAVALDVNTWLASPTVAGISIVPVTAGTSIVKLPTASSDDNVVVPPNVLASKIKRLMAILYS